MIWSVPAAIKWIRGLEHFDLQYVEQPVPDFDVAGMAQVRRSVGVPIAADEGCTSIRSALELIKADACDVFVVYPSEAGGLTRGLADRGARRRRRQVVCDRELGRARRSDDGERARRRGAPRTSRSRATRTTRLQELDVLDEPLEMGDGFISVTGAPGLGVDVDREDVERLSNIQVRESVFYDDIHGEAPRVGQIV